MKFLLLAGLLIGGVLPGLAQDIAGKTETPSEFDLTVDPGHEPLYLVSSMKSARLISKDQFDKIDHEQVDYIKMINDPSSTYIYGEKAKNGIVLIVMKGNAFSEKFAGKKRRSK